MYEPIEGTLRNNLDDDKKLSFPDSDESLYCYNVANCKPLLLHGLARECSKRMCGILLLDNAEVMACSQA